MRMLPADEKLYARFARYVRLDMPSVASVPAILQAMSKIGQINQLKLMTALKWGSGPMIKVTPLVGAYGEFTPGVKSNEIRIDVKIVKDFEAGKDKRLARAGNVHLVGVTLLHELVHWGDDQDGVDRPGEEGEEIEKFLYGGIIH